MNPKQIRIFEMFSGIGSFYQAFKDIFEPKGYEVISVGYCEWAWPAIVAYEVLHHNFLPTWTEPLITKALPISWNGTDFLTKLSLLDNTIKATYLNHSLQFSKNLFDVKKIKNLNNMHLDVLTYSFPATSISKQGRQQGLARRSQTPSSLMWEIERILYYTHLNHRPKYLIMENSTSLQGSKFKIHFNEFIWRLNQLGYESKIYYMNSLDYQSPQNRNRLFMISIRSDLKDRIDYKWLETLLPFKKFARMPLKSILEDLPANPKWTNLKLETIGWNSSSKTYQYYWKEPKFEAARHIYDVNYSGPTLTATGANNRFKIYIRPNYIREMNALECWRYMGWNDDQFNKIKDTNYLSEKQLKFLAGNSVHLKCLHQVVSLLDFRWKDPEPAEPDWAKININRMVLKWKNN